MKKSHLTSQIVQWHEAQLTYPRSLLDGPQDSLNYRYGHEFVSGCTCRLSTCGRVVIICNSSTETGLVSLLHTVFKCQLNVLHLSAITQKQASLVVCVHPEALSQ